MPAASDNSGEVRLETPAKPPPVNLTEGEYEHRYTAVDNAGNHDTCVVLITVKGKLTVFKGFSLYLVQLKTISQSDLIGNHCTLFPWSWDFP